MRRSAAILVTLAKLKDWDSHLLRHSGLPGPRANLELFWTVAAAGCKAQFLGWAALGPDQAPENSPKVFLAVCGVGGLGRLAGEGDRQALEQMLAFADDPRWRVREAVAMGIQIIGDLDPALCLKAADKLAKGNWLAQRACVAGLCEPRLLKDRAFALETLRLLDGVTRRLAAQSDTYKDPGFLALRQALGYGWSVAVAGCPDPGKAAVEAWAASKGKYLLWMVKENLSKSRLKRLDARWVARLKARN